MGLITARIDDKLELEFRKKILEVKGAKKKALSEAIEEAIKLWLEKYSESQK